MAAEKRNLDINSIRIAKPCPVTWDSMTGDDRVRHCGECSLNIYNTAAMNSDEVRKLIENHEGRLCLRLYRRADGTLITRDCPRGLRAYRQRVVRHAGAALAAVLGLFSVGYGQKTSDGLHSETILARTALQERESQITGTVSDPHGALVPGAKVKLLIKDEKNGRDIFTNDDGAYTFSKLPAGTYKLEITAAHFQKTIVEQIVVKANEKVTVNVVLSIPEGSVVVGIYAETPLIDMRESGITTTITSDMIRRIPK